MSRSGVTCLDSSSEWCVGLGWATPPEECPLIQHCCGAPAFKRKVRRGRAEIALATSRSQLRTQEQCTLDADCGMSVEGLTFRGNHWSHPLPCPGSPPLKVWLEGSDRDTRRISCLTMSAAGLFPRCPSPLRILLSSPVLPAEARRAISTAREAKTRDPTLQSRWVSTARTSPGNRSASAS